MLGLTAARGLSLVAASGRYSFLAVHGLLVAVASLVAEHGALGAQASVVVARGLSSCGLWALERRLSTSNSIILK